MDDLWAEFAHQAEFPPGGDEVIGACYRAVERMGKRNKGFARRLELVAGDRDMPTKHLVNLFFRAVQYMRFFEREEVDYPERFFDSREWEKELRLMMNGKMGESFFGILSQRDTGTTVYQRYAGPKAVLSALWPNRKLTLTDLGCGGNHGLPGLIAGERFKPVVDHTPETAVTKWIEKPIGFRLGLGVDKYDPYDPEMINWRIACSFYPSELAEMNEFLEFEKRVRKKGKEMFVLGDIMSLMSDGLTVRKYDAVILSTVLYQMSETERAAVLDGAVGLLKTDGVEIAQDFARKGEEGKSLVFEMSRPGFIFSL